MKKFAFFRFPLCRFCSGSPVPRARWSLLLKRPWATCSASSTIHVPSGWVAGLCFAINFLASIVYLWKRSAASDALAAASAEVGVVFGAVPAHHRTAVGETGVGHLVDVGCAPDHDADPVAHLRQLPGSATLCFGRPDASPGGSLRYLRLRRCSHCLFLDSLVPDAASRAGHGRRLRIPDSLPPYFTYS